MKADTQKLKSKIEEMSNNILEKFKINTNINTLWDYFKTKCTDIMEECLPPKTTTGFCLDTAMLESTKTISWSLMPGIALHLLIN
jgi:predicted transcriptional regulator